MKATTKSLAEQNAWFSKAKALLASGAKGSRRVQLAPREKPRAALSREAKLSLKIQQGRIARSYKRRMSKYKALSLPHRSGFGKSKIFKAHDAETLGIQRPPKQLSASVTELRSKMQVHTQSRMLAKVKMIKMHHERGTVK